ncbi:MAG: sulfur carrier protein ThiS [Pikeienuella sp.]
MKITVNGEPREVAAEMLQAALEELGYGGAELATAVNEAFVPAAGRAGHALSPGDRVEVLSPRQGG